MALALVIVAGCVPVAERQRVLPAVPEGFPAGVYREAQERGEPVYRVDTGRSLAVIRVYRGGRLAHLGHDHVVAARDIHGLVLWGLQWQQRRADLYLHLDTLTVDEPGLRESLGLTSTPSAGDIEKTRHNMVVKTLDTARFPFMVFHLEPHSLPQPVMAVGADITLHGETVHKIISVKVDDVVGAIRFSGEFSLRQSEFGITPFTALGGLLEVTDRVDIRFDIYATPHLR